MGGFHELPVGVSVRPLAMHSDERGVFTEVFRVEWKTGIEPLQWNVVRSAAGVLRGVHVHRCHADYLIVADGHATFGLRDLRPGSPTEGLVSMLEFRGDALHALLIPPGVAHGFYFHRPSLHVYSVSAYFDPADELGCRFDDPDLAIPWPATPRLLSERDRSLPPLAALRGRIPSFQPLPLTGG